MTLEHGDTVEAIARSIAEGFPDSGMPGFAATMSPRQIHNIALYVAEQRLGVTILDKRDGMEYQIPDVPLVSERHAFRLETAVTGLDPMPFSIAPLPDGRILLSERMRGLRIVDTDGSLDPYIRATPPVFDDSACSLARCRGSAGCSRWPCTRTTRTTDGSTCTTLIAARTATA